MPSESVGEWLADAFTVRIAHQDEATTHVAEPLPQGEAMPLRALTLLAVFPLALVASTGDHGRGGDRVRPSGDYLGGSIQRQGERQEEAQGAVGGKVPCIPDDGSGSTRSPLHWTPMQRESSTAGERQSGGILDHVHMLRNETELHTGVRRPWHLPVIYRKAGPIPDNTKVQVEALGEQAPHSEGPHDRDGCC